MKNRLTRLWACFSILALGPGIKAFAQPQANFTANPVSGCSPIVVNFTDQSTGNPTQWRWDLGNGTISFLQNPSATYFNPGTYNVKLVVTNASGSDSIIKNQYITVYANPTVNFLASDTAGCFPLPVQFTSLATAGSGTITNYSWDFGDGSQSSQQNPIYTYHSSGIFTITLRVTNSFGCMKTYSKPNYIQVGGGVNADFTNSSPGVCSAPSTISFTNTSAGPAPLNYVWNFGDGSSSTLPNPSHTYNASGTYTVSLIAVGPMGCADTVVKQDLISIGTIVSQFSAPDTVCAGKFFTVTNTTTPNPSVVFWDFGDGNTSAQMNPVKSYAYAGNYSIKLVNNFGACTDSITKPIVVRSSPTATFTANQTTGCLVPFTVNFSNQSAGTTSWSWNFGDGSTSTSQNPSHTYTSFGAYTVTLIATNSNGCSDTLVKTQYIQIVKPSATLNGFPQTGCIPLTINPTATVVANQPIATYLWNFGDGSTSTLANPTHTYNTAGTYTVSLIITTIGGCADTVSLIDAVKAGSIPTSAFTPNPTDVCAFQPIQFNDNSTGNPDQWFWIFGDGAISNEQNPSHNYTDTGYFTVTLIVWNNTCPDTFFIPNAVHIRPPIASYTVNGSCINKLQKDFLDHSIGATSWQWDFGDGTTSSAQNPSHTYAVAGSYSVTLTVTNGTCSHTTSQYIQVINEGGNLTADYPQQCKNNPINFSSGITNPSNISSWQWNFGDGGSSAAAGNVSHSYTTPGNYSVTLTISDLLGCTDTLSMPVTIYGPTAMFTSNVATACLGNATILFTDASLNDGTHSITQWTWNYGDGVIDSTSTAPYSHNFVNAGVYPVTLTVKDSYGCSDHYTIPTSIIVSHPIAKFFSADTMSCVGKPIQFVDSSSGTNLQYQWQFGDGGQSTTSNPVHNYSNVGLYTVSLSLTDQFGCHDTLTKNNYINISMPHAAFTLSDSSSTCPPLLVNFTNNSTNYITLNWDFGDGNTSTLNNPSHFYTLPGSFYPRLTITSPGGCTDSTTRHIQVNGPQGTMSYTPQIACSPTTITFTAHTQNNVSFIWDFSDGNILATNDSVVSHVYNIGGDFIPKVILQDASGCSVPIFGNSTITVYAVHADFRPDVHQFCDSGWIHFTNNTVSNDLITSYNWNFGDGSTSTIQTPLHLYNNAGIYSVSLFVSTQQGCSDSITLTDTIRIYTSPTITVSGDSAACTPAQMNFAGQIVNGNQLSWQWNFGNNQTDTLQIPAAQSYTTAGNYNVICKATDNHGCRDSVTKNITIYPLPATNAGNDLMICQGNSSQLAATGATNYVWCPSTGLSCVNCSNPVANPTDTVTYVVTGSTTFGCSRSDSVTVKVKPPFTLKVSPADSICVGEFTRLTASGADQYNWFPSTALSNPNSGSTLANPTATTVYRVVAKDKENCFADTATVLITVSQLPQVNAGNDITISAGTPGQLQATGSTDVINWNWTPQYYLSCLNCPNPKADPKQTTNYTITAKNSAGCATKDQVTVYVTCDKGNLFIPNTFSPNGDGANDRFYPRGTGIGTIRSLRVFNRWGELVYEKINFTANDAGAGWDGTYKGKMLSPDVFIYTCEVVCSNNEVLQFKGDITLIR